MGSLEIQIFVSLFVILGAAFVALLCDFLKGNNERLRERNIELQTRHEERDKRELLLEQAQRQAWNVAVQAQEAAAAQLAARVEEPVQEEAQPPEPEAPPAPSAEPVPGLAKAPNPQDDRRSYAEPVAASAGPIVPTAQDPVLPAAKLATAEAQGLGEEGPLYPEPCPLEIRIVAETSLTRPALTVQLDSGLAPTPLWSGRENLLGGEQQMPQAPVAPAERTVWDGGTAQLPSYLPRWVPQPVRDLLVRALPVAGQVPFGPKAVPASPASGYWTLVARWPIGRREFPVSTAVQSCGFSPAGLAALSLEAPCRPQGSAPGLPAEAIAPSWDPIMPVLGVGVTVGLRSGHLKPIALPALALRASLAQLPLELPIPAKPAVGRPPASDLRVDSSLPEQAGPEAAKAGLVPTEAPRPAAIAPIVADSSEAALPRIEAALPRFSGESERSLWRGDRLTGVAGPGPLAPRAIAHTEPTPILPDSAGAVLPRIECATPRIGGASEPSLSLQDRLTALAGPPPFAPRAIAPIEPTPIPPALAATAPQSLAGLTLRQELAAATQPLPIALPGAFPGRIESLPIGVSALTVTSGAAAIPPVELPAQPFAAMRDGEGLRLSPPPPSQPPASSFYPFAPLLERVAEEGPVEIPHERFELEEPAPEEPMVPLEQPEPVVRIRVLQEEDLRPLGDLTPLSAGTPAFFHSTHRGLEFREEAPGVEEAPLELEAGCTMEGGFAHEPVALQTSPRPDSRVVVMPAFDDLRAMFSPVAPSLQHRPEPPGNLLRMPASAPSEHLPAGMQDFAELERALRRGSAFSGAVMVVTVADHEKAVQQHGEDAIHQVLGDVQSFVAEAAGAGAFLSRTPDHELVFAWPRERVADPQPVFHAITEKLWDYQLRTLGGVAVIFSWGFHETDGDSFSRALGAAREQMIESRRPRKTTMTGVGRFRRLMVS